MPSRNRTVTRRSGAPPPPRVSVALPFTVRVPLPVKLESSFCLEALQEARGRFGPPDIFNSDQGSQFASTDLADILKAASVRISVEGRGRAVDNIFVERLWRGVKYEEVYLRDYQTMREAAAGQGAYFTFCDDVRLHQSLDYKTPAEVYA